MVGCKPGQLLELGHHCSHPLRRKGPSGVGHSKTSVPYVCALVSSVVPALEMTKVDQNAAFFQVWKLTMVSQVSCCTLYFCYGLCRKMFWKVSEICMYLHTQRRLSVGKTDKFSLAECGEGAFGSCFVSPVCGLSSHALQHCSLSLGLCVSPARCDGLACYTSHWKARGTQLGVTARTCHGPACSLHPATWPHANF